MNIVLLLLLTVLITILMSRTEMFTEQFGLSGYTKPKEPVLTDAETDLTDYEESGEETEVSNDLMQEMVLATNKEVSKKTGLCTYIIETLAIKKYVNTKIKQDEIYRCMFMSVKHKGFAMGFAVTSDLRIIDGRAVVLNLRTQPIDIKPPSDPSIYQQTIEGKEFEDYTEVRQSEIDRIKNTELIDKVIHDPQTMYGKINI